MLRFEPVWIGFIGKIAVYSKHSMDLVREFKAHRSAVTSIAIAPDRRVWSVSSTGTVVIIWDPLRFEQVKQIDCHEKVSSIVSIGWYMWLGTVESLQLCDSRHMQIYKKLPNVHKDHIRSIGK
jgi:hypothetical protein